jgi:hypothetical protein
MHNRNFFHSKWICSIENILNECGYSEYWSTQNVPKSVCLSKNVKQRLCDQFKQRWSTNVFNSAKCLNYRILKCSHGLIVRLCGNNFFLSLLKKVHWNK